MAKKTKEHYVDNEKLLEEIMAYKKKVQEAEENGETKPGIGEYLGECFLKIASHLSTKPNFANYTFRDDMISDAIENCLSYATNFDPTKTKNKPNPFAYFTQICYYAFLRRIAKEKKQMYIKYRAIQAADARGSFEDWAKNQNLVDAESTNAYADYLKLTSTDLSKFEDDKP
jgi:hypothetical protein